MSKVKVMTEVEAEEQLSRLRGWDTAHISQTHDGCVIIGHGESCICGRCPVLMDNGFFE